MRTALNLIVLLIKAVITVLILGLIFLILI